METQRASMEQLIKTIQDEGALLLLQLEKSQKARTASVAVANSMSAARTDGVEQTRATTQRVPSADGGTTSFGSSPHPLTSISAGDIRSTSTSPPTAASTARVVIPVAATHKEGYLLHLVKSSGLFGSGSGTFLPHYIVVSGITGVAWYSSEEEYRQQPRRPLGHANFWIETYNSRGSRFKKAAVCWPLLLPSDCPEALDSQKTYFAVDYFTPSGARDQIVLAASSPAERDSWVQFLTKYIDVYLAPRPESEALQLIPRGAAIPLHRSGVIAGEAPG